MKVHSRHYKNMQAQHLLACLAEVLPQVQDETLQKLWLVWSGQHEHQLLFRADKDQLTKAEKQFLDLFDKAYSRFYSARAQWNTKEPLGLPLAEGLLSLLCNDQGPAALPLEGQHLLLGAAGETLPLVYYLLCRHASHTQLAFYKSKDCLQVAFHIKDDVARLSTFSVALEDPLLQSFAHLVAYHVNQHILFLPQRPRDEKDTGGYSIVGLEQFVSIVTRKPALFRVDPQATQWLGAMTFRENDKSLAWLPLSDLSFRNQLEVMPPESLNAEVLEPEPAEEALESFKQELRKNHHAHYRLSLLPIPSPHERDDKHERLLIQKEKLDYELALLDRSQSGTELLLRYEHQDFPILATYLRSLSKNKAVLFSGQIRYCFQGAKRSIHGEGRPLHYLWVAAELVGQSYDPSLLFDPIGARTSVFQLDPFWVRDYKHNASSCLFVSRGTTLYPPIHPYDVEQIDSYMAHLLLGHACEPDDPPQRPMYLFESVKGGKLEVTVLDEKAFHAPCMTMGWLNDCAVVTSQDMRADIAASARDMTYLQLSAYLEPVGLRARATFKEAARDANASLKEDSQDLFAEMAREMEALLLQAGSQAKRILQLAPALKRYTSLANQHLASYKLAAQSYQQLRKEAKALTARAVSAEHLVILTINHARKKADQFRDELNLAIKRLKASRNDVLSNVKVFLNPFNRNK